jgi:protein-L-isoaspartate O-methyltransferase
MGFYQNQIVPLLINLTMRQRNLTAYRSRVVPAAEGQVLEIGIGSGLNLPFYTRNVRQVIGLDPSPKLLSMARGNLRRVLVRSNLSKARPKRFRWRLKA